MRWEDLNNEPCSLARTLSILGDRWTLIILRDCFLGVRRFEEFEERLGIARHVLASRLKKLADAGVLVRVAYQERPKREEYRLTKKGFDLYPVIVTLMQWGDRHLCGEKGPAMRLRHKPCGDVMEARLVCGTCGETIDARDSKVEVGPGAEDGFLPLLAKRLLG